jgi:Rrf2 family iron-responsive transcriptional regulator
LELFKTTKGIIYTSTNTILEIGMRLTKQTNYAVRMLMYCAANQGNLSRIPEIARAYGVSELFLFKILQPLNKAGLVETVRGRNGGVRLGKPAEKISLFDVVRVTEDSFAMAECFEDDGDVDCPLIDSCGLNSALRKALNAFFDVLSQYSIDDLVKARPQINFLLGITGEQHYRKPAVVAPAA